jgi:hypothetical protein
MVHEWNDKSLRVFLTRTMGGRLNAKLDLLAARTISKAMREEIIHYNMFKEIFTDTSHPFTIVFRSLHRKIVHNMINSERKDL